MTSNYSIRRAVADDAPLLSVLASTTFYEAYFEQDNPATIASYVSETFAPERLREQLADGWIEYYLAERGGLAVGFTKLRRGTSAEGVEPATDIELERIYVVERDWGKGAGQALLDHASRRAAELGFESIWLGVWNQNPRAIRFYEKNGFEKVGIRTFPYGDEIGINHVMRRRAA